MLHLVDSNKGRRNFNSIQEGDDIYWKALFKTSEDSLTSSIFGLLFYLPAELFWSIIRNSCYTNELPKNVGRILSYEFWPRWENEQGTYTEPDIFIQFGEFDLIVEAKRYEYDQQYPGQWLAEVNSYYKSPSAVDKKLYVIAIGGIRRGDEEATQLQVPDVQKATTVVKCRWRKLLSEIIEVRAEVLKSNRLLHNSAAAVNVLNDLILAFRIHGFVTSALLNSLPVNVNLQNSSEQSLKCMFKRVKLFSGFSERFLNINTNSINLLSQQL